MDQLKNHHHFDKSDEFSMWRHFKSRKRKPQTQRKRRRLSLERLESRNLMAGVDVLTALDLDLGMVWI